MLACTRIARGIVTGQIILRHTGSGTGSERPFYDLWENGLAKAHGVATPLRVEKRSEIGCDMLLRISKSEDTN